MTECRVWFFSGMRTDTRWIHRCVTFIGLGAASSTQEQKKTLHIRQAYSSSALASSAAVSTRYLRFESRCFIVWINDCWHQLTAVVVTAAQQLQLFLPPRVDGLSRNATVMAANVIGHSPYLCYRLSKEKKCCCRSRRYHLIYSYKWLLNNTASTDSDTAFLPSRVEASSLRFPQHPPACYANNGSGST
ncbi:uncharacterized protein ARMOST_05385 [Armillaria ostoyae]|uniref:Uncharacterized protein n=1 Tax=Armillaria ostoyae TaxID=47428 RepID=A0A284R018_ARMOS|nr:uncharacterized protein ARMOST_05385 [Armillaria ostoyae]